jgi:hypothetical protein
MAMIWSAMISSMTGCAADSRPAAWEYISPVIMQPNCATSSCHSRGAAVSGLDFSDVDRGYTSLVGLKVWIVDPAGTDGCAVVSGSVVCQRNFRPMVNPYNPEQSRLVNMLRARHALLMPPDRPLPEADIQLVERWIRGGALRYQRVADAGARTDGSDGGPRVTVTVTNPDGESSDGAARETAVGDATAGDTAAGETAKDAVSADAASDRPDGPPAN